MLPLATLLEIWMPIEVLPEITLAAPGAVPPMVLLEAALIEMPYSVAHGKFAGDVGADVVAQDLVAVRGGVEIDPAARVPRDDIAGAGSSPADRVVRRRRPARSTPSPLLGRAVRSRCVGADVVAQDLIACRAARETDPVRGVSRDDISGKGAGPSDRCCSSSSSPARSTPSPTLGRGLRPRQIGADIVAHDLIVGRAGGETDPAAGCSPR